MRISDWSSDVCSSDLFGLVAIRRDLRHQRVHVVELRLRPDEGVEGDVDFPSVKILGEVEEMRFEQFLRRVAAGPDAEIGSALQAAAGWQAAGDGVDRSGELRGGEWCGSPCRYRVWLETKK